MMKLIIQIPCFNEEHTLPTTLAALPKKVKGIKRIETQIIDDGSYDNTSNVAKKLKVNHLIRLKQHQGLATAFKIGVANALALRADILVNTDGDNQYYGKDIVKLVKPIINGEADIVIGCRSIDNHPEFSFIKKKMQKFGSWVVRKVSQTIVEDASSGFRAYNKEAMLRTNIFSNFSYCVETLIQAGNNNLKIVTCKIRTNPKTRESRLFKNIGQYLWQSTRTVFNIGLLYRSHQIFSLFSVFSFLISFVLVIRYLIIISIYGIRAANFWPTIILAGIILAIGFQLYLTGTIASLIAANRKLTEEVLYTVRKSGFISCCKKSAEKRKK